MVFVGFRQVRINTVELHILAVQEFLEAVKRCRIGFRCPLVALRFQLDDPPLHEVEERLRSGPLGKLRHQLVRREFRSAGQKVGDNPPHTLHIHTDARLYRLQVVPAAFRNRMPDAAAFMFHSSLNTRYSVRIWRITLSCIT